MLPISWPVSVVLAVLLSIIHLSYRIASNFHAYPTLFLDQVSFRYYSVFTVFIFSNYVQSYLLSYPIVILTNTQLIPKEAMTMKAYHFTQ